LEFLWLWANVFEIMTKTVLDDRPSESYTLMAFSVASCQLAFSYSLNIGEHAVAGHFAERHFAERHFAERHFAERTFCRRTFCRRTFCRTDVLPNGRFAERTFCRTDSLPKGQLAENRDVISSKCLGM
jgi:transposase